MISDRAAAESVATPDELQHYLTEAAMLRTCLHYNEEDHRFATEDRGRIVYIFDANIVVFFLQPERENENRKILAFGSDRRQLDYASSTALITAEYLFSRRLAGQRGNPALICQAHGDDLAGILSGMREDADLGGDPDAADAGQLAQFVDGVVQRLSRRNYENIKDVADDLRRYVPRLADDLENKWAPLAHLRRIYDDDLLRPLGLHPAATRDVLLPDSSIVKKWEGLIQTERAQRVHPVSRGSDRRDAEALVQTMLLDEAAQRNYAEALKRYAEAARRYHATPDSFDGAPELPEPVRYVMVTADQAVLDAYARWYWREKPARFLLRSPLQYVPVINTLEMPNSINNGDITQKAFFALDSLFGNLKQSDPIYAEQPIFYLRFGARGDKQLEDAADPFEFDPHLFQQVRENWHECYRTGTVLNSGLMARRHQSALGKLAAVLRTSSELREALEQDQARNLNEIVGAHAEFTTQFNVRRMLAELHNSAAMSMPPHRVPFLIRLENTAIPAALSRLLAGRASADDERKIAVELRDALDHTRSDNLFVAATIAFRRGHWIGARAFSHHGLTLTPSPAVRSELIYILAASIRYLLGNLEGKRVPLHDIKIAREALRSAMSSSESERDGFAASRALVEWQYLDLAAARRAEVHAADVLDYQAEIGASASAAATATATEILASANEHFNGADAFDCALREHRASLTLGTIVHAWLSGTEIGSAQGLILSALEIVDATSTRDIAPINAAYRLIGRFLADLETVDDTRRKLDEVITAERSESWISSLDIFDIERMLDRLGN